MYVSWPVAVLNPVTCPWLGPPTIEKAGWAPNGSVHDSDTATEPPPSGAGRRDAAADGARAARTRRRSVPRVSTRCADDQRLAVGRKRNALAEERDAGLPRCRCRSRCWSSTSRSRPREEQRRADAGRVVRRRRSPRCCPSADRATLIAEVERSGTPLRGRASAARSRSLPSRVNTHAAPSPPAFWAPPISAVVPSWTDRRARRMPRLAERIGDRVVVEGRSLLAVIQVEPLRVKTHAAPVVPLSIWPPISAVLPSPDSATRLAEVGRLPVASFGVRSSSPAVSTSTPCA